LLQDNFESFKTQKKCSILKEAEAVFASGSEAIHTGFEV